MTDPVLASEFPGVDSTAWRALVDKVLKGAPYDRKLVARTYDGLTIEALRPRAQDRLPLAGARAAGMPWTIMARMDQPEPADANAQALDDLNGGASGLSLIFRGAAGAYGFGLAAETVEDLDRALEAVRLDLIETRIEAAPFRTGQAAGLLMALTERRGIDAAEVHIDVGLDPLGHAAEAGRLPLPWNEISQPMAELARKVLADRFKGTLLRADTRVHHAAGAGAAQELAAGLATLTAYLRALDAQGLDAATIAGRMEMSLAADADQFETVAKFRAARLVWGALTRELGLAPAPLRLHAETSWRMTTRRDPHVNLLRATVAAFAAGAAGADSLSVLPFTQALGLPDGFARRLARNAQVILIEEANVHRVADAGAGSGTVETFTDALAERAWDLFRDIERHGGMMEALASGWWQGEIARVREARLRDLATRRRPITGTSEYPLIEEPKVRVLKPMPAPEELSGTAFPPLTPARDAEPFEALRDGAETGERPGVFLATLGPLAGFTPRASFARNLFAAGGIASLGGEVHAGMDALVAAFRASGARLACLCGTDETYGEIGVEAALALSEAGATVWLAGRPDGTEALEAAGVTRFIFAGDDALAVLTEAQAASRPNGRKP